MQRWLRAHIWLTILTIPLVILHSGFRFGGAMTTFLMVLYGIVMVSGFYGLFLQHIMPRLMKERLPAETVFEQIPHIRSQLAAAAEKMRDSFKPAPPKKPDAARPGAERDKSGHGGRGGNGFDERGVEHSSGSREIGDRFRGNRGAGGSGGATTASAAPAAKAAESETAPAPPSIPNAAVTPAAPKAETIGTPTARVQSDPPGAPVARMKFRLAINPRRHRPSLRQLRRNQRLPHRRRRLPQNRRRPQPRRSLPRPPPRNLLPRQSPRPNRQRPPDPASEAVLIEFIERQILPYLQARRGDRMRLNNPRFSDDTFRFVKLRVTEGYRSRVEEIQGWCDERRMLDVQVRLHHWLHGWLFIHVPFSFLLLMLTIWHACVTLFYY